MRRMLPVFAMSVMMTFFSVLSYAQSQTPKKVYAIYINDAQGSSFVLQDAEAADFNGVKCVKGTHVGAGWAVNRTVYIPVDRITDIVQEDSLDQYKADTGVQKK